MRILRDSVQTRSKTGTRRREVLKHTRALCRTTERRGCPWRRLSTFTAETS